MHTKRDPDVMSGALCIAGTRFPVAQFIAELAEGYSVEQIAEDYDLNSAVLKAILNDLAKDIRQSDEWSQTLKPADQLPLGPNGLPMSVPEVGTPDEDELHELSDVIAAVKVSSFIKIGNDYHSPNGNRRADKAFGPGWILRENRKHVGDVMEERDAIAFVSDGVIPKNPMGLISCGVCAKLNTKEETVNISGPGNLTGEVCKDSIACQKRCHAAIIDIKIKEKQSEIKELEERKKNL